MWRIGLAAISLCVLTAGCLFGGAKAQLRQDNPRQQTAAIARIVRQHDTSMVGELIRLLDSRDEGVRFMAATALHQLTDIDRGFHFAGPEKRKAIVAEWHDWYKAETGDEVPELPEPEEKDEEKKDETEEEAESDEESDEATPGEPDDTSGAEPLDPAGEPAPDEPKLETPEPDADPPEEAGAPPPLGKPADPTPGEYSLPEIQPAPTNPSAEAKEKAE